MMNMYEEWKELTLSQFWDKKILGAIILAISEELQEVYEIQQQIRTLTDLDLQQGVNLDHNGDIVCTSREDAQEILLKDESFEMTDELYRKVLKFMISLHSSSATYYDIIDGIRLIWNLENVKYSEDRSRPATYILDLGEQNIDDDLVNSSRTMTIKAAGVKVVHLIKWIIKIMHEWKTRVSLVEYGMHATFYGNVRRIDGSLQLNGSYQLNASSEGKGGIRYYLPENGFLPSVRLTGVEIIPHRLKIVSAEIYPASGATVVSANGITYRAIDDGIEITTEADIQVVDDLRGLSIVGNGERSAETDGGLTSGKYLSGAACEDGILITYAADAEFSLEISETKVF